MWSPRFPCSGVSLPCGTSSHKVGKRNRCALLRSGPLKSGAGIFSSSLSLSPVERSDNSPVIFRWEGSRVACPRLRGHVCTFSIVNFHSCERPSSRVARTTQRVEAVRELKSYKYVCWWEGEDPPEPQRNRVCNQLAAQTSASSVESQELRPPEFPDTLLTSSGNGELAPLQCRSYGRCKLLGFPG